MRRFLRYFTPVEYILWVVSVVLIVGSYFIFDGKTEGLLGLLASLIGVTSLILAAKGNPIAQALMIIFCIMYGVISYSFRYYGEMLTYVCMTGPMAVISLVSWLRNPFEGNKAQVKVNNVTKRQVFVMLIFTALLTFAFYFILKAFNTANLIVSTLSVTTSFVAVYLTYLRSPYYALAYAANDIVLIILWLLATIENTSYTAVLVCFTVFLFNDIYGYISWRKMKINQSK